MHCNCFWWLLRPFSHNSIDRFPIETLFESSLSMSCECTEYELRYFSSSALTIIPRRSVIVFDNCEQLPKFRIIQNVHSGSATANCIQGYGLVWHVLFICTCVSISLVPNFSFKMESGVEESLGTRLCTQACSICRISHTLASLLLCTN